MTDSNTPDQDPKPFKPDPKKSPFDRPQSEPRSFADPEPDKKDFDTFQISAIKCAQMGEKLIDIIGNNYPPNDKHKEYIPDVKVMNSSSVKGVISRVESLYNLVGKPATIEFTTNDNSTSRVAARRLGTGIPPNTLTVFFIADEELAERHKEFIARHKTDSNGATDYFFTPNGGYFKVCYMPWDAEKVEGKTPLSKDLGHNIYESEMTAEDFEIAGQALAMLIKRAKNPYWDQEPQQT